MARYVATVDTDMTPEKAFDYMADLRNFAEWDPGVSSSKLISGSEPGLGATFRVKASGATLEYETKEYEPHHNVYAVAKTTFFTSLDRITVEARDGGGCRVTYDAELQLNGPLCLVDPLLGVAFNQIGSKAEKGLQKALDGLSAS